MEGTPRIKHRFLRVFTWESWKPWEKRPYRLFGISVGESISPGFRVGFRDVRSSAFHSSGAHAEEPDQIRCSSWIRSIFTEPENRRAPSQKRPKEHFGAFCLDVRTLTVCKLISFPY